MRLSIFFYPKFTIDMFWTCVRYWSWDLWWLLYRMISTCIGVIVWREVTTLCCTRCDRRFMINACVSGVYKSQVLMCLRQNVLRVFENEETIKKRRAKFIPNLLFVTSWWPRRDGQRLKYDDDEINYCSGFPPLPLDRTQRRDAWGCSGHRTAVNYPWNLYRTVW